MGQIEKFQLRQFFERGKIPYSISCDDKLFQIFEFPQAADIVDIAVRYLDGTALKRNYGMFCISVIIPSESTGRNKPPPRKRHMTFPRRWLNGWSNTIMSTGRTVAGVTLPA
ncbi:MAG: hypothetical protein IIU00_00430 [Clostridia bacterium]|nr:hypothetical protein [Clostridia bacterium]